MKKRGFIQFEEDILLNDDLCVDGTLEAHGNLTAHSIYVNGVLTSLGDVKSTIGSIVVEGQVKIHNNLFSADKIQTKGSCTVEGNITAKSLEAKGPLTAKEISTDFATLTGDVTVQNDLVASDSVTFVMKKRTNLSIKGIVHAPTVNLKYAIFHTKWATEFPDKVLKLFGKRRSFTKEVTVHNLRIKTDSLNFFHPYRNVKFIFSDDCEIDAKKTEYFHYNLADSCY